ncbi:MAG: MarR family transcriptional regulator [Ktedonobacteraceae bacterium]|nr:MarR family transcriptional regulator [Ktedonobacteraceae bacterium]
MTEEAEQHISLASRVIAGLSKISLALKSQFWQEAGEQGLTPTQGQILAFLRSRIGACRLSELANGLAVTQATASEAIDALVRKGLVRKTRQAEDRRALALTLTPAGEAEADRAAAWPDFLLGVVDVLSPQEQAVFLRGLIKMIRTLQERGQIPVAQMCVTCHFFQPYVYADAERPHHCAFVNAPFGDRDLRLACPDHQAAPVEEALRLWERFVAAGMPADMHGERDAG